MIVASVDHLVPSIGTAELKSSFGPNSSLFALPLAYSRPLRFKWDLSNSVDQCRPPWHGSLGFLPALCGMVALDSDFGLCRTSVWDLHLGRFDFPDFQDLQVQFPERPPMRIWTPVVDYAAFVQCLRFCWASAAMLADICQAL